MIEFLPDAEAVHVKLCQMFTPKTRDRRRVIIVAYVGKDAETLLPDFHGQNSSAGHKPGPLTRMRSPIFKMSAMGPS